MKFYEQKDFVLLSESNPFSNKLKPLEKTNLQTWPSQSIKGLSNSFSKLLLFLKVGRGTLTSLNRGYISFYSYCCLSSWELLLIPGFTLLYYVYYVCWSMFIGISCSCGYNILSLPWNLEDLSSSLIYLG